MIKKNIIIIISICFFTQLTFSQIVGSPFLKNYSPKQYNGHHQVWTIVEDNRGVLFLGTTSEIIEFDGIYFRRHELPNKTNVRALTKAKSGKIYVGSSGDIGYLEVDNKGQIK